MTTPKLPDPQAIDELYGLEPVFEPGGADAPAATQFVVVQCPYCGQGMELLIDTTIAQQRFTTDCEVCCRPFEVFAECEPGEIISLEVQA